MEKEKPHRASEKILALIHTLTAEKLLVRLQSEEPLTPAEVNAISKFLKDNEITADFEAEGTPHKNLLGAFNRADAEAVGIFNREPVNG